MRYYKIQVINDDGTDFAVYESHPGGKADPGALQVELDMEVNSLATPRQAANIKIWGIDLFQVTQSQDFRTKIIRVFAGMDKGLPLAKPGQIGQILEGRITGAFGNWIGTNIWIQFTVNATGTITDEQLKNGENITLNWKKGQKLADAIRQTFALARPDYKVSVNISDKLVLDRDEPGTFPTLNIFGQYILHVSQMINPDPMYTGVNMTVLGSGKEIRVDDGTTLTTPIDLQFEDLIGQPTWVDQGVMQVITVMRGDLQPYNFIRMPQGALVSVSPAAGANENPFLNRTTFQGVFKINSARHIGNFRQAEAASWITVFDCTPPALSTGTTT